MELTELWPALVIGVVIAGFIWWKFRDNILFVFRARESVGIITNWMGATEKGVRFFYPLIDFTPDNGERISFRAEDRCEGQPMYPPGTEVRVKYLPSNPSIRKVIYPPVK